MLVYSGVKMGIKPKKHRGHFNESNKEKCDLQRIFPELLTHGQYEEIERLSGFRKQLSSVPSLSYRFLNGSETKALEVAETTKHDKTGRMRQQANLVGELSKKIRGWWEKPGDGEGRGDGDEGAIQKAAEENNQEQRGKEVLAEQKEIPKEETPPILSVYCQGRFQVYEDDQPVRKWPNGKRKSIFKYLICHRQNPVGKDILMDEFWPGIEFDAARNSLIERIR